MILALAFLILILIKHLTRASLVTVFFSKTHDIKYEERKKHFLATPPVHKCLCGYTGIHMYVCVCVLSAYVFVISVDSRTFS